MHMTRHVLGLILAISCATAAVARADSETAPSSAKDQFVRIQTAQKEANERYSADLEHAREDDGSKQREIADRYADEANKNANAGLDLARKYPQDQIVVEALRFVIQTARMGPSDASYQAIEILAHDHVTDGKMG